MPTSLRRELLIECCHKCSIPICPVQIGLQPHHINYKRNDNRKENLLMLCPNHHDMATKRIIDRKACLMYKENLSKTVPQSGEKNLEMINDCTRKAGREEFRKAMLNWSQAKDEGVQVK